MADQPVVGCSQPGAARRSSPKLKSLLLKTDPLQVPGTVDAFRVRGTLVFGLAIGTSGEVTRVESVSGHPVMISAAMQSIRAMAIFVLTSLTERKKEFYGRITIKYQAIGRGVTYQVF
jgi:hypothetical protein